jgi:hypothetical protein
MQETAVPTKKKPKTEAQASGAPDPRAPLPPTPANLQLVLDELEKVLADLPPPVPKEPAPKEPARSAAKPPAARPPEGTDGKEPEGSEEKQPPPKEVPAAKAAAKESEALPQLDLVDAMLHIYFADGLPCGFGQEVRRRIQDSFVDRNEFRVTEAFEVEDLLRDLAIPDLFDRCLAVRDSVAQVYNDQNGVSLAFLREASISDRNTFFQRVPALQPHVVNFLTNLLTIEDLCFSEKSTLRAQQRIGLDPKDAGANKFLDRVRALLKPYGHLPLDVGPNLPTHKPNLTHTLSPACILVRLGPPGKKR